MAISDNQSGDNDSTRRKEQVSSYQDMSVIGINCLRHDYQHRPDADSFYFMGDICFASPLPSNLARACGGLLRRLLRVPPSTRSSTITDFFL